MQGANQIYINKQILKGFQKYPDVLKKYDKNYNKLLLARATQTVLKGTPRNSTEPWLSTDKPIL